MSVLTAREAYDLWAPTYATETAISFIENRVVAKLSPDIANQRVLDAGCGVGRRIPAHAVGIDISERMLQQAKATANVASADVRGLPFADASFDVVWCRLVLGHLPDLTAAYAELARVLCAGGVLVMSDFHPIAAALGHKRTFKDQNGRTHEVTHYVHSANAHTTAARAAGLLWQSRLDGVVGADAAHFYEAAGRAAAYEAQRNLPVVLALSFQRS